MRPRSALDHPTRRRFVEDLAHGPGLKVAHLARRAGISHNAAKHHVRVLHRLGLLVPNGEAQPRWTLAGAFARPAPRAGS